MATLSDKCPGKKDTSSNGSEMPNKSSLSRRKRKNMRKKILSAAVLNGEPVDGRVNGITTALENIDINSCEQANKNTTEKANKNVDMNSRSDIKGKQSEKKIGSKKYKNVNPIDSQNHSAKMNGSKINGKKVKRKILKRAPAVTVLDTTFNKEFREYLKSVIVDGDFLITGLMEGLRIKLGSSKYYISLISALKRRKIQYFTFAQRRRKVLEVVVRGLPIDSSVFDIRTELINLGYNVKYVMQLTVSKPNPDDDPTKPVTVKEKTPLFLVALEKSEESKRIFNLKQLLYFGVKIEERRKKDMPVQCKKCQRYGHTGAYCQCKLRCVKCAAEHGPKRCPVKERSELRCANCSKSHPASYHGCQDYKLYFKGMKKIKLLGSVRGGDKGVGLIGSEL